MINSGLAGKLGGKWAQKKGEKLESVFFPTPLF